jgi:hypothetical protein
MATEADDRWYVQFDSQEVRLMTLDEIQEAFEAGLIHENTYLIEVGSTDWKTLSVVAGLGEEDEAAEEQEAPPAAAPAPHAVAPAYAAPTHAAPAYAAPANAAPAYAAPRAPAATPMQNASSWPPVATGARAPLSVGASAPYSAGLNSTMPVVQDLDFDVSGASFKSGKRTALIAALAAVVVLGGGGFALAKMDAPEVPPAPVAAAPVATTSPFKLPDSPSPTPASNPTPSSASNSSSQSSDSKPSSSGLSEDMKKALLASDKDRTPKAKASKSAPAARRASASGSSKKGSSVFKAGGSEHDPLNSKL